MALINILFLFWMFLIWVFFNNMDLFKLYWSHTTQNKDVDPEKLNKKFSLAELKKKKLSIRRTLTYKLHLTLY